MTWLKENWFKLGIIVASILIGGSFLYYFFSFLPAKQRAETIQAKEKECTQLGQEKYGQDAKNEFNIITNNLYKYNRRLDSCFYMIEYTSIGGNNYEIIDLKTNAKIAYYFTVKGFPMDETTSNQMVYYVQKKNEIFYSK